MIATIGKRSCTTLMACHGTFGVSGIHGPISRSTTKSNREPSPIPTRVFPARIIRLVPSTRAIGFLRMPKLYASKDTRRIEVPLFAHTHIKARLNRQGLHFTDGVGAQASDPSWIIARSSAFSMPHRSLRTPSQIVPSWFRVWRKSGWTCSGFDEAKQSFCIGCLRLG